MTSPSNSIIRLRKHKATLQWCSKNQSPNKVQPIKTTLTPGRRKRRTRKGRPKTIRNWGEKAKIMMEWANMDKLKTLLFPAVWARGQLLRRDLERKSELYTRRLSQRNLWSKNSTGERTGRRTTMRCCRMQVFSETKTSRSWYWSKDRARTRASRRISLFLLISMVDDVFVYDQQRVY